ncbi:sigma-70 family RNA polymerase sigma factor [Simiduia sp. 21SJ11W-1]|uniref:RNA polymerase sigma factor n=1 Tax=Simiduia sp. 21SJ11W-1 TaxID=2909669 RepID=UPI00209CB457|nr:sigma-70 family RNA polymerase sigma factor [Simiduia sp. 21SJ11W-1]UTA46922.1 sigma-70 family RNA polymerase sigma factor [Simiduia sp. 21SJ11W-1]
MPGDLHPEGGAANAHDPALAALFQEYTPLLKRFLWARVHHDDDVADLLHETYERLQRHGERVDLSRARSLLFTIARNLVIDRARHQKVSEVDAGVDVESLMDPLPTPEQRAIDQEAIDQLNRVIEALPPQCRRVFVMRKIHQFSQKAIAEKLGISVSTVEKHVAAGMRQCRSLLQD